MTIRPRVAALVALLSLMAVSAAIADLRKLDPTARIAMHRLRAGETAQALAAEGRLSVSAEGELDVFVVGNVTRAQLEGAGARVRTALPGVFTAWIPLDRMEAVAALGGVSRVEGAQIDQITNDLGAAGADVTLYRAAGPDFTGMNGAGVIVGNVDTGVDYDHADFKNPDGTTRILKIWDQTSGAGLPPSGFGYGTEWNSAQINSLASTAGDTHGHGTHTMGSIAGDGSATAAGSAPAFTYAGMAPKADIIVVDGSVSGGFSRPQMLDAATYIFGQATAFGKNCVVNMSIGSQSGPKDGTDAFELGIDALSGAGKIVVMSAGNDRNRSLHAEWFPGNPNPTMFINSGSGAFVAVGINGYYEASEQHSITITTPNGTVVGPVALGAESAAYPGVATPNGSVYIDNGMTLTSTGDKQVYIEFGAANGGLISGLWTFTYTPVIVGAAAGEVDMFRVGTTAPAPIADFVDANQPDQEIISALATGVNSVAAGAYVTRQTWTHCAGGTGTFSQPATGNIASFSSPGPTRDGRIKPDVAGAGTAIASARTADLALACTFTSDLAGFRHVMNQGTSMSAPHVSGAIALLYQKYGALTPTQVQTLLHNRAKVDINVTIHGPVPNEDFGWGKLNVGDLADPLCAVTYPNGGETWAATGAATITWNASDNLSVTSVDLELTRNNGGSWETIATGIANTGSYVWTVTGPATIDARVRATARDAATNSGLDLSDAVFTISTTAVGVEPVAGAAVAFELAPISPSPAESGPVRIEFALPREAEISLAVHDVHGRRVAELVSGRLPAGRHVARWNSTGAGGLYFIHYQTPEGDKVRKLAVVP